MDLSGVIFVVLAVVWAVYLIPKALKQHDEVARTRSIDRFSADTRVVARREPVSSRDARLVIPPPTPIPAQREAPAPVRPAGSRGVGARRTAALVAARRRRRLLSTLLLCLLLTGVAAHLGHLSWWAVAVPGGLTSAYLVLCRVQVGRQRRRRLTKSDPRPVEARVAAQATAQPTAQPDAQATARTAAQPAAEVAGPVEAEPAEAVVEVEVVELREESAARVADGRVGGDLWDPLPVTLPTYVTKPKARRTVRTIDLGEPGTWTSGHTLEDAEIAARATDPQSSEGGPATDGRRAVNT